MPNLSTPHLIDEIERCHTQIADLRRELARRHEVETDQFWYWQTDGGNHLESLTCQIIIRPDDLRAIINREVRT